MSLVASSVRSRGGSVQNDFEQLGFGNKRFQETRYFGGILHSPCPQKYFKSLLKCLLLLERSCLLGKFKNIQIRRF